MQNERELLDLSIDAAIKASEEILKIYGQSFDVELKDDRSPLTEADKQSHIKIVEGLKASNIPILSEEGAKIPFGERSEWERFWMVDPLDGTKEFIKRNGEFTVNIALIENGVPVMGVIVVPVTGVIYAGSSLGAFKGNSKDWSGSWDDWTPSASSLPIQEPSRPFTVVASRSHLSTETQAFLDELKKEHNPIQLVSMGSSLKICLVAEGAADIYPRFAPTMEWDTAAGHGIARAAGKDIIDFESKETMPYNKENLLNKWFIVS